jgi:hypothetical protein
VSEEFAGEVENDNEDDWRRGGPRLTIVGGSGFKRRQQQVSGCRCIFTLV